MIVMKFGGTSNQDAAAMANVAQIVKSRLSLQPIVVISAISKATNALEQAGKLASEGKSSEARQVLQLLMQRHYLIVDNLVRDKNRHAALQKVIAESLMELEELVRGVAILKELTPRTLDSFYCYGELLSSRIVAAGMQEAGIDAVWIDTKDFMITDDGFTRAQPVIEIVEERLSAIATPLISEGKVIVTQGFIGMTASGRRTTMGRESSDYSAAVIGAALDVDDVQIWTDVDGILTADPTVVPAPKKIRVMSFEEAFELSYFGAKVLHPNTMLPAIEKNIPIHIYNSRRPHLSGTRVVADTAGVATVVKSVAYRRDMVIITVSPKKRYGQYIFWDHIYNILTQYGATAALTASSEYNVSIAMDAKNPIEAIVHEMNSIGDVRVMDRKAIVCVVGSNIRHAPGIAQRLFRAISELGISMISFGSSPSNICLIVDDEIVTDTVRNIHREFFEEASDDDVFEELEHFQAQV